MTFYQPPFLSQNLYLTRIFRFSFFLLLFCVQKSALAQFHIGGLLTESDGTTLISDNTVDLSGNSTATQLSNGNYLFPNLAAGGNYTITPSNDLNPLNGVSTYDLVLMSQHILGVNEITNPYCLIAADASNDGNITTFDIVQTRQLILFIIPEFPANTSWRFIDKAYTFPVSSNPWFEAFPESITIDNLSSDLNNVDFIGVKIGDVSSPCSNTSFPTSSILAIEASDVSGNTGADICTNISVSNFDDMVSLQYSMHWDPLLFQFSHTQGFNIPDLTSGNFGTSMVNNGTLTFSWNASSGGGAGVSVSDNTSIYEVCFTVLGANCSQSSFSFDGNPTAVEATQENMSPTNTINFSNAILDVFCNPPGVLLPIFSFCPDCIAVNSGENFSVDIKVEDFENLLGFQYLITFDETVIQPQVSTNGVSVSFTNTASELILVQGTYVSGEGLRVSWNSLTGAPTTIPSSIGSPSTVFSIPFTAIGTVGETSLLDIDCLNFNCEIIGQNSTTGSFEVFSTNVMHIEGLIDIGGVSNCMTPSCTDGFQNGDETGIDCGGTNCPPCLNTISLSIPSVNAPPNTTICMPITADSFDDIIGFQYSMDWNPSILTYTGTQNYNADLLAFGASNFNSTAPGDLNISWNHPSNTPTNLADGAILYEVCFQVIGSVGQTSTVSFTDTPLAIEIIDSTGPNVLLNANNGSVTVTNDNDFNITITDIQACPNDSGGVVCVPFVVAGFNQIIGTQWTIEYDDTVLDFNGTIQNVPANVLALSAGNFNETASGQVRFSWPDPTGAGVTLADGETYFEMCFDVIGTIGSSTAVSITGNLTTIEITAFVNGLASVIPSSFSEGNVDVFCDCLPPVALCQDITVQLDDNNLATITASNIDNGSSTECGMQSMSIDQTDFDCTNIGANNVNLTVTDINNNSSNCSATVTVEDNTLPVAICQDISLTIGYSGQFMIWGSDVDAGSYDNCGIASMTVTPNTFDCTNVGINTVVFTVTDNSGNTSNCTATVTVSSFPPVAICQEITVNLNSNGQASISASDIDAGSFGICPIASMSLSQSTFDCTNVGITPVTLTVTDIHNNSNACIVNVYIDPSDCATCDDGIQNRDETGIDCGGTYCPPCAICTVSQYYSGIIFSGTYQTSNSIGTDAFILGTENVSLLAETIDLDPGFDLQLGAEFLAAPVPCVPFADNETSFRQEEIQTFTSNSIDNTITFTYYLPTDDIVELSIHTMDGLFEEILIKGDKRQGEHLVQIGTASLKKNVYILLLKTEKRNYFERVVIE